LNSLKFIIFLLNTTNAKQPASCHCRYIAFYVHSIQTKIKDIYKNLTYILVKLFFFKKAPQNNFCGAFFTRPTVN